MKTFTINGKEYKAKEFDFEMVCDFEEMGLSMADMDNKQMSFVRAYFAICINKNKTIASREIQQHIMNGGTLEELISVMFEQIENSDFFQNAMKQAENADNSSEQ